MELLGKRVGVDAEIRGRSDDEAAVGRDGCECDLPGALCTRRDGVALMLADGWPVNRSGRERAELLLPHRTSSSIRPRLAKRDEVFVVRPSSDARVTVEKVTLQTVGGLQIARRLHLV